MTSARNGKHLWYTVGPATLDRELEAFLHGATGVRLTFNFGTVSLQHKRAIDIKNSVQSKGFKSFLMADLGGEKFRLGAFDRQETVTSTAGTVFELIACESGDPEAQKPTLPVSSRSFFSQLTKGARVIVGDGAAILEINSVGQHSAQAEMIFDGTINQKRGLTIQGSDFRPKCLTSKDIDDLKHVATKAEYDAIALSFVSSKADVLQARSLLEEKGRRMPIVAKIETSAGVSNIDEICQTADYVMAARGDLALAIPWIELPAAVNAISDSAVSNSTPWILATQVAEGLERFGMPTRAEICDLAHWMQEGCDGVLLSYETVFGSRPIEAIGCTAELLARWS